MTRLTIGIDGYNLAMPRGTGVATYGVALSLALQQMGHRTTGVFGIDAGRNRATRELMFFDQLGREPRGRKGGYKLRHALWGSLLPVDAVDIPLSDAIEKRIFADRLPAFDRIVSRPFLFETADRHFQISRRFLTLRMDNPPDVMHWTYPVPIRLAGARNIYTLHDLVPLRLPYTTLDNKRFYYRVVRGCVMTADHIVTVSDASRDDILSRFPVSPDLVTNSYQTAPMPIGALDRDAAVDAEMIEGMFGLKRRGYFLFYGALDPKKNIGRIVEAYLATQTKTPLVIVGGRHWGTDQESRMFANGRISVYGEAAGGGIRSLDYLPRDLLLRLVRGAKALVFPSLYEGFGLPVLEAIRLGTPVITSNVSSLPEVAGDAGLQVDPYDVEAIANAIRAIDTDPAIAERLIAAGRTQIEKFSEAAYRERLAPIYEQVMKRG